MSYAIKATKSLIYYCATDKLRVLRIERWGSNAQKYPEEDWFQAAY